MMSCKLQSQTNQNIALCKVTMKLVKYGLETKVVQKQSEIYCHKWNNLQIWLKAVFSGLLGILAVWLIDLGFEIRSFTNEHMVILDATNFRTRKDRQSCSPLHQRIPYWKSTIVLKGIIYKFVCFSKIYDISCSIRIIFGRYLKHNNRTFDFHKTFCIKRWFKRFVVLVINIGNLTRFLISFC